MAEGRVKEVIVDSRINKVLSLRIDSASMIESFDAISSFYVENTVEARRSLRQDLELENILIAKKFLAEFDIIRDQVIAVEESSNKLENSCQTLAYKVSNANENMKQFMKKAAELDQLRTFQVKQSQEISNFLQRFQLSKTEIDALYLSSIDDPHTSKDFFNAFSRLKIAYIDCKNMVESNNYTAGFELLEALGQHQDTAYQRLFEWVKVKCESLTSSSENTTTITEDIDVQLQFAIKNLRTLPMYFAQCQDLIVNSRRGQLVQKFVLALTQGNTNATPGSFHGGGNNNNNRNSRAIDLHCHDDPVRYVGDMLAWMHQTLVSEQEFLEAIFNDNSNSGNNDGSSNADNNGGRRRNRSNPNTPRDTAINFISADTATDGTVDKNDTSTTPSSSPSSSQSQSSLLVGLSVDEMLVRCLQGLGRPLRLRITQTLDSRSNLLTTTTTTTGGAEVLYSLTDLLAFYESTFVKLIPLENAVHSAIRGSLLECKRAFLLVLNKQAELLVQSTHTSTILDLSPTDVTKDCAKQIREMLRVYHSAMSVVPSDSQDDCYIDTVLGSIIQPLLQGCRLAGQTLGQSDMAIFMLNNVYVIKSEVSEGVRKLYSSSLDRKNLSQWLELLDTEAEAWLDVAAAEETTRVLHRSDIEKLLELMEVLPKGLGLIASQQIGLSQDRINTVMRAFYASLLTTSSNPLFDKLLDIEQRELARLKTAVNIADCHAKVYAFIKTEEYLYDSSILIHSDAEVRVLLQIDDDNNGSNKSKFGSSNNLNQ